MSVQKDVLRLVDAARKIGRAAPVGMEPLDERAVGIADRGRIRARLKPQDLVSFLLRYRVALRIGPPPRIRIAMSVFTPAGKAAVELGFGPSRRVRSANDVPMPQGQQLG